jgi:DNA-binding ferritin-like protein (Dps family)
MEEENFKVLIEIIRIIEKEEFRGNKVGDAISSMIDNFYPDMREDQKKKIREEFLAYIRRREEI